MGWSSDCNQIKDFSPRNRILALNMYNASDVGGLPNCLSYSGDADDWRKLELGWEALTLVLKLGNIGCGAK